MKKAVLYLLPAMLAIFLSACSPFAETEEIAPAIPEVRDPFTFTFSYAVDAINPEETEFPGGRGTDEMVVYTSETSETTGTNHYGVEAVVREGIIIQIQDNDNVIPKDGFVISGHEAGRLWILDNLKPGMKAELDIENSRLYFTTNSQARLKGLEIELEQMQKLRQEFTGQYSEDDISLQNGIYEQITMQLEQVRMSLDQKKFGQAYESLNYLDTLAEQGFFLTAVSPAEDFRGVWDRLTVTSPEEIREYLDEIAAHGYNMIFPETYNYGLSIYPSQVVGQQAVYEGWDPLAVIIEEAHKRNIEVHAWVHVAFIGFEDSPLRAKYPQWLMQTQDGVTESIYEQNFYYFSWGVQEAREFLKGIYRELAKQYPSLDGIHFDYIRWPLQMEGHYYGFHPETRQAFIDASGIDPRNITPDDREEWSLFNEFKEGLVTSFLRELIAELKEINSALVFSGAVASPLEESARGYRNQNWGAWAREGLFDFLTPMIYTYDSMEVYRQVKEAVETAGGKTVIVSGLSTYQGQHPMNIYRQVHQARRAGSPGYVSFSWASSTPEQRRVHKYGPNRNPAVPLSFD